MTTTPKVTLSTVADLIERLQALRQDALVYLSSDAEGNQINPLDYADGGINEDDEQVILVPMHAGWERYV